MGDSVVGFTRSTSDCFLGPRLWWAHAWVSDQKKCLEKSLDCHLDHDVRVQQYWHLEYG